MRCWESNPGPLQEQQVLLTTSQSFRPAIPLYIWGFLHAHTCLAPNSLTLQTVKFSFSCLKLRSILKKVFFLSQSVSGEEQSISVLVKCLINGIPPNALDVQRQASLGNSLASQDSPWFGLSASIPANNTLSSQDRSFCRHTHHSASSQHTQQPGSYGGVPLALTHTHTPLSKVEWFLLPATAIKRRSYSAVLWLCLGTRVGSTFW